MTIKTFFTSDLHFSHFNVIKHNCRPYGDPGEVHDPEISAERKAAIVHEMNEGIIAGWNEVVGKCDIIYVLGDVSFANAEKTEECLSRLNGVKILIYGNHDKVIRTTPALQAYFSETHELLERNFSFAGCKPVKITLCHFPMRSWYNSNHGALHLFGHSHGTMPDDGSRSMDVGVDCHGMKPISLEYVVNTLQQRPLKTHNRTE